MAVDPGMITDTQIIDLANFLARDRSTTQSAMTANEKINLLNELYDYIKTAAEDRITWLVSGTPVAVGGTNSGTFTPTRDGNLKLTAVGGYLMTTSLTNLDEIHAVFFETEQAAANSVATIETTELDLIPDHGEFLSLRAKLGQGTAPKYVHWRRKLATGTGGNLNIPSSGDPTIMGLWEILIAPSKVSAASVQWPFSARVSTTLSDSNTNISAGNSPPLSNSGAYPELFPHECRWIAYRMAYEIHMRNGGDPVIGQLLIRNLPEFLQRTATSATLIGHIET